MTSFEESYSKEDIASLLELGRELLACQGLADINKVLKARLLLLFKAQSGLFFMIDPREPELTRLRYIEIPQKEKAVIGEFLEEDPLLEWCRKKSRLVGAYDLDLSRESREEAIKAFCRKRKLATPKSHCWFSKIKTGMWGLDLEKTVVGFGFFAARGLTRHGTPRM